MVAGAAHADSSQTVWWSLGSFAHAQPVSVHAYINDWSDKRGDGDDAVAHASFAMGWSGRNVSLSYVQQYSYEIAANKDSADLYHSARNRLDLPTGRRYALNVNASHVRVQGLRLGYRFSAAEHWQLELGLSALEGVDTLNGTVGGDATAVGEREYDFDAAIDYFYRDDVLLERPREAELSGRGLSIDLLGFWRGERWAVRGRIDRVFGFIDWRRAQFTQARATSNTRQFDEQGFVTFDPALSGVEGVGRFRQRLRPQAAIQIDYTLQRRHRLGVWVRSDETLTHIAPSYSYKVAPQLSIGGRWLPRDEAFGLMVASRWGEFSLMADRVDRQDAHLFSFGMRQSFSLGR